VEESSTPNLPRMVKDACGNSVQRVINVVKEIWGSVFDRWGNGLDALPSGERATGRVAAYDEASATRRFVVGLCRYAGAGGRGLCCEARRDDGRRRSQIGFSVPLVLASTASAIMYCQRRNERGNTP
jgi:hypothetical protein